VINLKGRVAIVTGAGGGLGRAYALLLAQRGARVVVNDLGNGAETVTQEIIAAGGEARAALGSVTDAAAVNAMVQDTLKAWGRVDILVNNAGIAVMRELEDLTEEEFDHTMAVNLKSAFLCMQAVLPGMRERQWGRVVNISSGAARGAGVIGAHYNASKAGMEGLTRGYAARLVKEGITVNAIAPSLIDTGMLGNKREELAKRVPLGRLGTPDEVAQSVLMVIGNAYLTGQTIQANGGMHFN